MWLEAKIVSSIVVELVKLRKFWMLLDFVKEWRHFEDLEDT
jgi:hypothetical protein